MARADLLKQLFRGFQHRDEEAFRAAAQEIIREERKKHHSIVANELERILRNGEGQHGSWQSVAGFQPPPQDADRKAPLFEIRHPDRYLPELVLPETTRKTVRRVTTEFREWEVLEANGLSPANRILFCGPSGCGKTATAEAIAAEVSLPLLYVRFDAVVSSLLGETAANLRKVFDYAARGQWVMLFDEFDAIGRSRDDVTEHGEIKRVVNTFLQIVDGFRGRSLIIAATNFEQALDPAIWRRFDEVVRFERPTDSELNQVIQLRLAPLRTERSTAARIAQHLSGSSYADAERVSRDIRKSAALAGRTRVEARDVEEALERFAARQKVLEAAAHRTPPVVDHN